jgi:hypothetical protein
MTEEMVSKMVLEIKGSYKIQYHANGHDKDPVEIDFTPPWWVGGAAVAAAGFRRRLASGRPAKKLHPWPLTPPLLPHLCPGAASPWCLAWRRPWA